MFFFIHYTYNFFTLKIKSPFYIILAIIHLYCELKNKTQFHKFVKSKKCCHSVNITLHLSYFMKKFFVLLLLFTNDFMYIYI